jgi:cell division protein FtsL
VGAGGAVAAPPLALRLAHAGVRIGDARVLDRLVRGRAWIAIIAVGLLGIVFMQVSMLQLNAGISRAVTSAETLHRQNATMRAEISKLESGERIGDAAAALGMIAPPAGDVNYLDGRKADGRAAARAVGPPEPVATTASTTAPAPAAQTQAQAPATPPAATTEQSAAPAAAAAQAAATATQTAAPAPAPAPAPAQTEAAPAEPQPTQPQPEPQATAPQAAAPATTAPSAPSAAPAAGAAAAPQGN